ncbi:MAG: hypothetical protein ACLQVY_18570, partial [Limisphaerales bacterium]
ARISRPAPCTNGSGGAGETIVNPKTPAQKLVALTGTVALPGPFCLRAAVPPRRVVADLPGVQDKIVTLFEFQLFFA